MESLFTKDKFWLDKWDAFLQKENQSSHLLYSDWLASYKSYGFDFEVFILHKKNEIVGGFGAVIAKSLIFKFYIIPFGPIFKYNNQTLFDQTVIALKNRAKTIKCCYAQFSLPIVNDTLVENRFWNPENLYQTKLSLAKGNFFKYVYSQYGLNWISFKTTQNKEEFLKNLNVQVRRNINLSLRNEATFLYAENEADCKLAYKIIEKNALDNNYSVRSFEDFKDTILSLIKKKKAFLLYVLVDNEIKGAAFFVDCGNFFTYITGGTKKDKPDLKIGYLLHWKIIEKSFESGYLGYNISLGGSNGVKDFKSKFNTQVIYYNNPHRFFIINKALFGFYKLFNSIFVKNKKFISSILKFLKKQ